MTDDYTLLKKYLGDVTGYDLIIYPNNQPQLNLVVIDKLINKFDELGENIEIKEDKYDFVLVEFPLDPLGLDEYILRIHHDEVFIYNLTDDTREYIGEYDSDCSLADQIIQYFNDKLNNQIYTIAPITYNIAASEYLNIHNLRAPLQHLHRLNFIYLLYLMTHTEKLNYFNFDLFGDKMDIEEMQTHLHWLTIGHHSETAQPHFKELVNLINPLKTNGNL